MNPRVPTLKNRAFPDLIKHVWVLSHPVLRLIVQFLASPSTRQSLLWVLLLSLPLLSSTIASADVHTRRVLVFSGYGPNRPALTVFSRALRAAIRDGSQARVEFFDEFQENIRTPNEKYDDEMVGYLRRKYEGQRIDLVIVLGAPALKFLLNHESQLFTDTPKIFYLHDEREETVRSVWPRVTGVWAHLDLNKTLDLALALHPGTKRVYVVSGSSEQDRYLMSEAQREFRGYESKAEFTYLIDLKIEELKDRLSDLPKQSVVVYLSFFLDRAGDSFSGPEALSMIAPTSSAPIYGIAETYMGAGIVGGSLLDFGALGRRTGELGLRVLAGESAQDIPLQTVPNITEFDSRELRHWNVSEQKLPPGSVVRFKEPTFWGLYGWYVIGIIAACLIEALLIVTLLFLHSRRRRAERESERLALRAEAEHNRLDEVISNVPGIVWETRIDAATNAPQISFVSEYVEKMLGYNVEEWLSTPGLGQELVHEEDRDRVARESEAIVASKSEGVLQFRWMSKDGRVLWVEAHLAPILDEAGKVIGMRGVTMDITDQKATEDAKRQSEERNRAMLLAIPDLMFLQTRDGTYLDYRAKHQRDLPVSSDSLIGKNMRDVLLLELAERFFSTFQLAEDTGEPQILEYKLTLDGAERWFEAHIVNSDDKFLSVVRDITERMHAEDTLRLSEARFREMADTAPVMIWISGTDKRCTYFNQQWLDFTGSNMQQLLGDGWAEGIHPDDYARCLQIYCTSFEDRKGFETEYRLRRGDGEYRWVLNCGAPRFSSDGGFAGYIGSCIDMTERRESEHALRKAHEELSRLKNQLEAENIYLQEELQLDMAFGDIVGQSDAIKYVLFKITQFAPTDATVMIMGETGTGKELVARAIHDASLRKARPLIKVDCGALTPSLIESELFGHEKGAFTGAGARKLGRFELANGGTIFLDEIGELPPELQVKLLRVIQEGELERLGGTKTIKVDVRIIAATNKNLQLEVEKGTFRQDLWYRLNVFPITVPPLRQHKEDFPLLVEHFVNRSAKKFGKTIESVSARAMRSLQEHSWPGNVRELINVIDRAVINSQGSVLDLVERFEQTPEVLPSSAKSLEEIEREYIVRTLENAGWRIEGPCGAAKILGLNPSTLRTRMAKLHIQRPRTSFVGA